MISYKDCTMCPHLCHVDRRTKKGFCKEDKKPKVAWCGLHKGEEPPISGENGSMMFFFTGCVLHCQYCQNYQISLENDKFLSSVVITSDEAMEIAREADRRKCATISLVTPEHHTPFVLDFLKRLKEEKIALPIVYNTSGWISKEAIELLLPFVDIWLWDTKTGDGEVARKFCGNENYPIFEKQSFEYLYDNFPLFDLERDKKGIIVRHLVFPSSIKASKDVIRNFSKFKDKCYFSLMTQFENPYKASNSNFEKITKNEYKELEDLVFRLGIENGFLQEIGEEESWMPNFNAENPFLKSKGETSEYFSKLREAKLKYKRG